LLKGGDSYASDGERLPQNGRKENGAGRDVLTFILQRKQDKTSYRIDKIEDNTSQAGGGLPGASKGYT
jgi:hypothetical protein